MFSTDPARMWSTVHKIAFRFFFLFIGFFLLNYEFSLMLVDFNLYPQLIKIYTVVNRPLHWLDRHVYHQGYDPRIHESIPSDNHYGVVFMFTTVVLFVLITVIWTIIDRRRPNYNRLNYWFRFYVRYMVALIMLGYGLSKLIPVQMPYPGVIDLLTPLGELDRFTMAWDFIGASPGYEIFTGICEVTAAMMLLFRRTAVAGSMLMCAALANVVAMNTFYGIGVKLYSSLLLLSTTYLLLPYVAKLVGIFFFNRAAAVMEPAYRFHRPWKKYTVMALVTIPVAGIIHDVYLFEKAYRRGQARAVDQKLYDVSYFISRDSLPPLLTDTVRWKRFAFVSRRSAVVYTMRDSAEVFDCNLDTVKHTCRLHNNDDSTKWDVLQYAYPQKGWMSLSGSWKGRPVNIMLKEVPIDSMRLNKERLGGIRFYAE